MPEIVQKSSPGSADVDHLRPYAFHGLHLDRRGSHGVGTCPFCGRDQKFSADVATGLWRCFVCGVGTENGGGNDLTFIRELWDRAELPDDAGAVLVESRRLLSVETVRSWGVRVSPTTRDWLVPGWTHDGRLGQLYRWCRDRRTGKSVLLATPGQPHGLFGVDMLDPTVEELWVCEGPWDAMALWEVLRITRATDAGLELTGSADSSLAASIGVVAVPGCTTFRREWLPLFRGKRVVLLYDSDHPRVFSGKTMTAGWDGARRAAGIVATVAADVRVLRWGPDGYDPARPSGFDVRDLLTAGASPPERVAALGELVGMVEPVPDEWSVSVGTGTVSREIEPSRCDKWEELEESWSRAMRWRQCLSDVLSVSLAVVTSTSQTGNQLFLQMIGDAGSGKTAFCDAMLVSNKCFALEHLTGFHSGWKGENGEDCSLIGRINHKTLITPEGDVLMSSPRFVEIMSQQRRIFDGTSGATYKNTSEDKRFTGLRTPWIIAGTPALMDTDQSRLGDRFLRVCIDPPGDDEKQAILAHVWRSAFRAVVQTSNCDSKSTVEGSTLDAYRLTGGYVNWLRDNAGDLIAAVEAGTDQDTIGRRCADLAELTADMRARPNTDKNKLEVHDTKEMPTRLTHQYVRLAVCLAVVLNKRRVDDEVMRRVRKVALDTSRGRTLDMVRQFAATNARTGLRYNDTGIAIGVLSSWTGVDEVKLTSYLNFLAKIGVAVFYPQPGTRGLWRLSKRVVELYSNVTR